MSSIKLSPNASGTGEFTIAAPNTNTNRTLTLPDQTGTFVTTDSSGAVVLPRVDSSNEGGQINFNRALDNVANWSIDSFGNTTTPTLRFVDTGNVRAAIDGSGNFLLGTTTARNRLTVQGTVTSTPTLGTASGQGFFGEASGYGMMIGTSGFGYGWIQQQRVDGSATAYDLLLQPVGGNLLVGTTSSALTSGLGFKFIAAGGTNPYMGIVTDQSTNGNANYHLYSTSAGAYRFYVGNGGTVYATSTTISAISDIRFKENVRDLDAGLAEVMALKPRLYDWKEGKGADIKNARGFIAQEFEQVFPDLIDEWKDPAPEGEEPYKSVRQDLIPVLVKAIQEQQAMIKNLQDAAYAQMEMLNQLTTRIAALEAK